MMVDRRSFVAGAGLAVIAPALPLLPPNLIAPTAVEMISPALLIDGWSVQGDASADNQVWIRVGHGWRTAWR
jgi:hypothetical protein